MPWSKERLKELADAEDEALSASGGLLACSPEIMEIMIEMETVDNMRREDLVAEVIRLRDAIRKHRDQRLDDWCCMDDIELYEVLPEGIDPSFIDPADWM